MTTQRGFVRAADGLDRPCHEAGIDEVARVAEKLLAAIGARR